jgi:hypothetical protein
MRSVRSVLQPPVEHRKTVGMASLKCIIEKLPLNLERTLRHFSGDYGHISQKLSPLQPRSASKHAPHQANIMAVVTRDITVLASPDRPQNRSMLSSLSA